MGTRTLAEYRYVLDGVPRGAIAEQSSLHVCLNVGWGRLGR